MTIELPATAQVRDGIWAVALPQPVQSVPYAFVYAILDENGGPHLIDSGWSTDENWERLVSELGAASIDIADVKTITATHMHQDHLGLSDRVRSVSGARLALHSIEQAAIDRVHAGDAFTPNWQGWGVPDEVASTLDGTIRLVVREDAPAEILLEEGDQLPIPGRDFRVLHTPGHTLGHICIVVADERMIFTGDHVLPTINPGIGLGGHTPDALGDGLASLARMQDYADWLAMPGHEFQFENLGERAASLAEHHLVRAREVAAALDENPSATVWQVAQILTWSAGFEKLGMFLPSALAQTDMHMKFVRSDRWSTYA